MKEVVLILDGVRYEYVTGVNSDATFCEGCGLKGLCSAHHDVCTCFKLSDDLTGIFKQVDTPKESQIEIPDELLKKLQKLGILPNDVRDSNIGASDYSKHVIQPWAIWQEYNLNPWDADIIKRILRTKQTDPRRLDYEKIIHICQERIRQIDNE